MTLHIASSELVAAKKGIQNTFKRSLFGNLCSELFWAFLFSSRSRTCRCFCLVLQLTQKYNKTGNSIAKNRKPSYRMMQVAARKKVSFNEDFNKQGESAYTLKESQSSWMRRQEMNDISHDVHRTSLGIQFKQPTNNPKSYASVLTRVYASCLDGKLPSKQIFQLYVHWNRICPERRGIEKYCVKNMMAAMKERTSDANIMVLAIQTQLVLEKVPLVKRSEKIQAAYKAAAQPARVLARIRGISDAASTQEVTSSPTPVVAKSSKRSISTVSQQQQVHDVSQIEMTKLPTKKRKFFHQTESALVTL
jgi:hypothetical protein